jgi:hypothetical protein
VTCGVVVVELRGLEPLTPCMPVTEVLERLRDGPTATTWTLRRYRDPQDRASSGESRPGGTSMTPFQGIRGPFQGIRGWSLDG